MYEGFPGIAGYGNGGNDRVAGFIQHGYRRGGFPVSGQPLPLISKGGTSIWMMSFGFGVMLSVSRYAVKDSGKKIKTEKENDLPEDWQAANPTNLA